ncbi:MAG TPA: hypothetical protein VMP01_30185 [Pirellulaceae bacterium]|nr:hypothetical protein [Pirellulaceae bacterium]
MSLFSTIRDLLIGRQSSRRTTLALPAPSVRFDDFPPFNLHVAELMRFDPQVRVALGARNGLLMSAQVEVTGPREEVNAWVEAQWDRVWCECAHQLVRAKLYGFQPFEVYLRQSASGGRNSASGGRNSASGGRNSASGGRQPPDGSALEDGHERAAESPSGAVPRGARGLLWEIAELRDRPVAQTRLLTRDDRPVGFVFKDGQRERRILAPRGLVVTFDAECSRPYGCALLARAYPAWFEKWMRGGAKETLRLRMMKDAYVGDIFWYPADRKVTLPSGEEVSWRDLAREITELRQSGGAIALPMLRDRDGSKALDYSPPTPVFGHTQILTWKRDLDLDIWKSLEIPPEIIQAATTGSGFSGRWIPFVVALAAVQTELAEIIRCVDRDLLRPLSQLNFGTAASYEIRAMSLVETYAARFGEGPSIRMRQASDSHGERGASAP